MQFLDFTKSDSTCFNSIDEQNRVSKHLPIEYFYSLSPSGMLPHKLILKIGAIVMLLRNINRGLCYGTRILILNSIKEVSECIILCGSH